MKNTASQPKATVFEKIGGSFQFRARKPSDLVNVLKLDPSVWAALCVPVAALNGDLTFFKALDLDGNGTIRVDEVKAAVRWLLDVEKDITTIEEAVDTLDVSELNPDFADGALLAKFIPAHPELSADGKTVNLAQVRARLAAVTAGPLKGDGVLSAAAVAGSGAEELHGTIAKLFATNGGIAKADLDKFLADAQAFIEWAKTTEKPLFRAADPVKFYDILQAIAPKLDEYFRFSNLVKVDPAHAKRFELDGAALPPLDLADSAAVNAAIAAAPLAKPDAACVIDLTKPVNPAFQTAVDNFKAAFSLTVLSEAQWCDLKAEFASYIDYLKRAQGDLAGSIGREKLEAFLAGTQPEALRKIFAEDETIGGVVDALKKLERVLLYKKYLLEFVNNFVSFEAFFNRNCDSMLQAGRLVMDGHSYALSVWIADVAAHRKIAMKSNLCLMYLEVTSSGAKPVTRKLAVAVTGGALTRIYIGKPAFFIGSDGITYNGKIVDLAEGPISFWQTIFAPVHRLSEAIGDKLQKLTDFSSTEKKLEEAIAQGKLPAATPPPPPAPKQGWFSNGSAMMLAGGLSIAAIGASASYVFKAIAGAMATISAMSGWAILLWVVVFLAAALLPAGIFAHLKMRKRNVTLFLEAGGWAVNLPMRLTMLMSGVFTKGAIYPDDCKFELIKKKGHARVWLFVLLIALVLIAAAVTWWHLTGGCPCGAVK